MAVELPINFRSGSGNLTFNVSYFDYAAGAGYVKYYLAGTDDSVSIKRLLTTDSSLISDLNACAITATGDYDFDLTFNNPAQIAAADATINYGLELFGNDGFTVTAAWTIYHVTSGGVETSLGSITDTGSVDGNPLQYHVRCVKIPLSTRVLGIGEKLRVNVIITTANSVGSTFRLFTDPSGHISYIDVAGGSANSRATLNIPFKIDL